MLLHHSICLVRPDDPMQRFAAEPSWSGMAIQNPRSDGRLARVPSRTIRARVRAPDTLPPILFIDTAIGARSSTRSSMSECTLHSSPLSRHPTSRSRPAKQSSSNSSIPMSPQLLGPTPYRAQTSSLSPCFSLSPIMLSPRCGPVKTMRDYRKFSRGWFWSARD